MAKQEKSLAQIVAEGLSGKPVFHAEAQDIVHAVKHGTDTHLPVGAKQTLVDAAHAIQFGGEDVPKSLSDLAGAIASKYGADEK